VTVILVLLLVFEALLFTIFTAIMLGTQLQAIWNDETVRIDTENNNKCIEKKFTIRKLAIA